ncbi:cell division-associated protein-like protein [Lophiotrema nucula]|uniref:separase n=1 Tax=Lophiotrema nucula TaxID=690887 RepID=A0A6A5YU35_9PLEO|nr:cell division-associated protein-like protein [Lophiotrema nucula]
MATKAHTTRARIENVKAELQLISTCTASTVAELQGLLLETSEPVAQKENVRVRGSKLLSVQSTAKRKGTTTSTAAATIEATKLAPSSPTARERCILATEAANLTLKSLADALKSQPAPQLARKSPKPTSNENACEPPKARTKLTKSASASLKPLQERSVSQVINSPKKPSPLRRSSSYTSCITGGPERGIIATANCARIAFTYLRTPEASKIAGKDGPGLQLENGILALIGKLVAHKLDSHAVKELRVLKRRLERFLGTGKDTSDASAAGKSSSKLPAPAEKETLASLLDFGEVDCSSPALPIIITHQLYTLRIIALSKRPRTIEAAWEHLTLVNPSSPANLLSHIGQTLDGRAKAARQLESLAQILLSLCPGISAEEDPAAGKSQLLPSPETVLMLQHLALKIRQTWWTLAKHQGNKHKELLEPLSKYLSAFARRSSLAPMRKYRTAESLFEDLLGEDKGVSSAQHGMCPEPVLARCLSSLAQAAGLHDEALRYLGSSAPSSPSKGSSARDAVRLVQIATLCFESSLKNELRPDLGEKLGDALEALSGGLGGSPSDLDCLFTEVNAFRRLATRALSVNVIATNATSTVSPLRSESLRITAASVHFCARFIGTEPAESDAKAQIWYNDRLLRVVKYLKSIVDSVLVCSKQEMDTEWQWSNFDSLVQDCIFLLHACQAHAQLPEGLQLPWVRLSNACWAIYLRIRQADGYKTTVDAMTRSICILEGRPLAEQRAGLLVMKLEKLGELHDSFDHKEDSRVAFSTCIKSLIEDGALQTAIDLASKSPVLRIFEDSGCTGSLGRVIKLFQRSYIKGGLQSPDDAAFFDNVELPIVGRGLMLEWQLALYLRTLSKNRPWDVALNPSIHTIALRLAELYTSTEYPVRRRRAAILYLRLAHAHPEIVPNNDNSFGSGLGHSCTASGGFDADLAQYETHLAAMEKFVPELRQPSPSLETLRGCLATWQTLVESATSWADIARRVDDPEHWLQELQLLADFLGAKGEDYIRIAVLHLMTRILKLEDDVDSSKLMITLCSLALQYLRLGYSGKAGLTFVQAESFMSTKATTTEAKIQWYLGYAEYLLKIGSIAKTEMILAEVERLVQGDPHFMKLANPFSTLSSRVRFNRVLADATYVYSLLALQTGYHKDAARYVRQSVSLCKRVWVALESNQVTKEATLKDAGDTNDETQPRKPFDPISSMRNDIGAPLATSMTHANLNGPELWSLVPVLYRTMMHHSVILAQQGLLEEAVFVVEQAEKVAWATKSQPLIAENISQRAAYWAESGRPDKAEALITRIDMQGLEKHLALVSYHGNMARVFHVGGRYNEELASYDTVEIMLNNLSSKSFIRSLEMSELGIKMITESLSTIDLNKKVTKNEKAVKGLRGRKPAQKSTTKAISRTTSKVHQSPDPPPTTVAEDCSHLIALQAEFTQRKVLANLLLENITNALEHLKELQDVERAPERTYLHLWATFKAMLANSMKQLAQNFALNTLPDSTIGFPAVGAKDRRSSEGHAASKVLSVPPATSKNARGKKSTKETTLAALNEARDHLKEAQALCAQAGSTHTFQQASSALGQLTVLLSALAGGEVRGSMHPLYAAYMGENPKIHSLKLAQISVEVEQENVSRDGLMRWPELSARSRFNLPSASEFQTDLVDIIPKSWAAVSLALSEARDEIYITRYEADHTPFVLRIPLARHASRDMDEEEFSFDDGRTDLDEIIELSDFSTRTAKDMTSKEARTQWWAEREALDERLRGLLVNMENIWLGGFKGIFSQHPRQPTLLARFRKSFENILNRHLPSRRGKSKHKKVVLEPRVLELFVGLGDANDEKLDLDEPLTDLVYFVIDILQFSGEHNAYDEIDFDAMVVETLDALRAYHDAAQKSSDQTMHTILVLDKNLHVFPWESMPCLQTSAISRLPSLVALRERLSAAKSPLAGENTPPGHYIRTDDGGTSILNPSGDLSHTLNTIKPRLDNMNGDWSHIVGRAPSEKEFESSLKEKELVLYFGHGSGAQFVRSKSVRRLYPGSQTENESKRGCATTFLFGCSSAHLTENGIYEPSGMLASYLTAGAPAVVGMLWDVTDKDCDRFAVKAGELWGLWPESKDDEEAKTTTKSKGKGRVAQLVAEVESARGPVSTKKSRRGREQAANGSVVAENTASERRRGAGLDEAVRDARDACYLRYLNGAAAVVYGIPVYLE